MSPKAVPPAPTTLLASGSTPRLDRQRLVAGSLLQLPGRQSRVELRDIGERQSDHTASQRHVSECVKRCSDDATHSVTLLRSHQDDLAAPRAASGPIRSEPVSA
jgi:hypothetical protein